PRARPGRSGRSRLARGGCMLTGQLGRRPLLTLLLTIQTRLTTPGALEVVTHVEAQPAEPLDFELDHVAVLESAQAAVVGAGGENVAGLQRVDRRDPLDAARDLVGHVTGVEVLLELAIDPQLYLESVRIAHLVGGDDVGADGREGVARLHLVERVAGRRQATRGA